MSPLARATQPAQLERARSMFLIVGVILPLIVGLSGVVLTLLWLPQLPDPAATHWSGGGPDGSGPPWTYPVLLGAVTIGLTTLFASFVLVAGARGAWGPTMRFLGAMLPATVSLLTVGITSSAAVQRGLTDWRQAPETGGFFLIGLGVAALVLAACWFLQPRVDTEPVAYGDATPVTLGATDRTTWIQTARTSPAGIAGVIIAVGLTIGATILAALVGSVFAWVIGAASVLIAVLTLSMLVFVVRLDDTGLTVRAVIGWPQIHIPLRDVVSVGVVDVSPMADFGGWGLRYGANRTTGVVVRRGEAIEVVRQDGRRFVVTVDDAARGAGVLAALIGRDGTAAGSPASGEH